MPRRMCRAECCTRTEIRLEEIVLEICDQYTIQGDLFSLSVLNDTEVPTPLEDASRQHEGP